ncbi:MAG: tRNA epoxyqueuosine(34) reductase QueG [Planctomycetaceae bacterium]
MPADSILTCQTDADASAAGSPSGQSAFALKREARRLGFDLVGIAPAVTPIGLHEFLHWLEQGHAGEMTYLSRRQAAYAHPRHVLDGVRSVVMLGMNYNTAPPRSKQPEASASDAPGPARVARYAQAGRDYHGLIREKLNRLSAFLQTQHLGCKSRGVVDTAPLLERDFARLAGLGWFAKNTMLINRRLGSWFFLAALLTDVELEYDPPHDTSHCGTCTRCLDACPTQAFAAPYVLDARRCISYLTIELRGSIPEELRAGIGDWLFGCDVCQEVCPWNRKAPANDDPALTPRADLQFADAVEILALTEREFQDRYSNTALARPKLSGLRRNAAIVLGNLDEPQAVAALERAAEDADPVVREAAAWALARITHTTSLAGDCLGSAEAPEAHAQ